MNLNSLAEELRVPPEMLTFAHLESYLWGRKQRLQMRAPSPQDFVFNVMLDCLAEENQAVSYQQLKVEYDIEHLRKQLEALTETLASSKKEPAPRASKLAKMRCQVMAKYLWSKNPEYTTREIAEHPDLNNHAITGGAHYATRTLYDWVAEVDPRNKDCKVGRPRKRK